MDLTALRKIVQDHPEGVVIRLVDGTKYEVPHRDFISLGPPPEMRSPRSAHATSFLIWDGEGMRLVNALVVAEVVPIQQNGKNGKNGHKKRPD